LDFFRRPSKGITPAAMIENSIETTADQNVLESQPGNYEQAGELSLTGTWNSLFE